MHSSIRNSPMITESSFLDKTKMTTIYIKLKVSRTDIHTHAYFISIDNARYDCPGFPRAYERRVHRSGTQRAMKRPANRWRVPIASTIDVLFSYFQFCLYLQPVPGAPKQSRSALQKFLLEARWPFSFSKSFCYSVACQSMKVTINTNITVNKVQTDISLCPWHDRLTPY